MLMTLQIRARYKQLNKENTAKTHVSKSHNDPSPRGPCSQSMNGARLSNSNTQNHFPTLYYLRAKFHSDQSNAHRLDWSDPL